MVACLAASALFVSGCSFPDRGSAIADDIRDAAHPAVERIDYGGDGDDSGPTIEIWVRPGTTHQEARDIICDIVKPAIARGAPPEALGVVIFAPDREFPLAHDQVPCS